MVDGTAMERVGDMVGFSSWQLNVGSVGNFVIWILLSIGLATTIAIIIGLVVWRRTYKHKIPIWGLVGNNPVEKEIVKGKTVAIGSAGDKLMYITGRKKLIPFPTIQSGKNKWIYWEREDGELINIGIQDVDLQMKQLGVKFIDTDMRMQRLGIEKNLQFRLQQQGFWEKHGQMIINVVFYVLVMMILIVLFVQWRKTAEAITKAVTISSEILNRDCGTGIPSQGAGEGSGLLPALIMIGMANYKVWRKKWELK